MIELDETIKLETKALAYSDQIGQPVLWDSQNSLRYLGRRLICGVPVACFQSRQPAPQHLLV